jgi:hypothetical protein
MVTAIMSSTLAMQKVEGSNPFSRSPESLAVAVDAEAHRGDKQAALRSERIVLSERKFVD